MEFSLRQPGATPKDHERFLRFLKQMPISMRIQLMNNRKVTFTLIIAFALCSPALLAMAPAVRAQSALDGFDPNANNFVVALGVQADGKIVVGGAFTSIAGQPRNKIARLNPDGSLDTSFDPNADNDVYALAVQADGKILVGGFFTSIGGGTRNRIARLNPDGSLDTNFDPNANSNVRAIGVQADGKILVGGAFT